MSERDREKESERERRRGSTRDRGKNRENLRDYGERTRPVSGVLPLGYFFMVLFLAIYQ